MSARVRAKARALGEALGGRSGRLGEFAIAYDEGKVVGVLEGSGGVADVIRGLLKSIKKRTRSKVVFDKDPKMLVDRLLDLYGKRGK